MTLTHLQAAIIIIRSLAVQKKFALGLLLIVETYMGTYPERGHDTPMIPEKMIMHRIYYIRGRKIILDGDLAILYGVETAMLKRQVRRNISRFPGDFMFEITLDELRNLRCQIGTSKRGGERYAPMAFTEMGVAMLSSVLNSERAIQANILIMRAFTNIRTMMSTHEDLRRKIEALEEKYDGQFRIVFDAIRELLKTETQPGKKIGFNSS